MNPTQAIPQQFGGLAGQFGGEHEQLIDLLWHTPDAIAGLHPSDGGRYYVGAMPEPVVDLRSDTFTRPTPEMRKAMAEAEVGDDAYGEDPTVRALEEAFASQVGKEAGLFVPSGVMANQVALRVLGRPGTTVVAGRSSHIASFEAAASGMNSSAQVFTVDDSTGSINSAELTTLVEAAEHHWARPSVVCVENTHMWSGGVPWDLNALGQVAAVGVPVFMDGARLFNAVVATGTAAADYAAPCALVWAALTKGLGAPVGSVMAGSIDVMAEARLERLRLGGQMRQAGILAAAGLVALTRVERLAEDHAKAHRLAEAVGERWPAASGAAARVRTNIVAFPHPDPDRVLTHLSAAKVLGGTVGPGLIRLVTHLDIDDAGVERACAAIATAP